MLELKPEHIIMPVLLQYVSLLI